MARNKNTAGILYTVGCMVIYGLSFLFSKQATDLAGPLWLLGWRFTAAFLVMNILRAAGLVHVQLRGKDLRPLAIIALLCPVIYFIGETYGIRFTTASESGAFISCIPAMSLVASALVLHKRPTRRQVAGIFIAMAGVLLTVFALGITSTLSVPGYAFLTVAVISYALYGVFVEKTEGFTGMEITYAMLAAGAVCFAILALIDAARTGQIAELAALPFRNGTFLTAVLYQGIGCSIVGFFLSNAAIACIGMNRTVSFAGINTLVSVLSGAIFLRERFTAVQALGAAVILAGVTIANTFRRAAGE
jgi:drug/metabolite transporter (DMT)-like permease